MEVMSATALSPHQFGQQSLFSGYDQPLAPHHQTPAQFASDPQTVWHGRIVRETSTRATKGASPEGFHAGTRSSAIQRVEYNARRRGVAEGMVGRMYPLRVTGPMEEGIRSEPEPTKNPFRRGPGSIRHYDLAGAEKGYRYTNDVEDAGSVSVGAPQRKGFMDTYRESVESAKDRGEYVHPNIAWAAKNHPDHTGERIVEPRRYGDGPHRQMQLAEGVEDPHVGAEIQRQMSAKKPLPALGQRY